MTTYMQRLENTYDTKKFSDVKNMIDWIIKSLNKAFDEAVRYRFDILYHVGEICCSSDSIEDLIENAYGASGFELVSLHIMGYDSAANMLVSVFSDHKNISIDTDSKSNLERTVQSLNNVKLSDSEINNVQSNVYANYYISNNGTINVKNSVLGNNNEIIHSKNSVVGDNNCIDTSKKNGIKEFFVGILQSLLSKGIWYILCAFIGALIALLFSNK